MDQEKNESSGIIERYCSHLDAPLSFLPLLLTIFLFFFIKIKVILVVWKLVKFSTHITIFNMYIKLIFKFCSRNFLKIVHFWFINLLFFFFFLMKKYSDSIKNAQCVYNYVAYVRKEFAYCCLFANGDNLFWCSGAWYSITNINLFFNMYI